MPPQGDQCPFCQLIANPEQLNVVGETENFYAWLEYPTPRAKGHANVVPKEHRESVLEFSPEEWQEAMQLLREVMGKAMQGLDADGLSITMNVKEAGGQMLPHAYIQVFPRFEDEERAGTPTGAIFPQREDLQGEVESIKQQMDSVTVDFGSETREAHPDSQKHKQEKSGGGFNSRLVDSSEIKEEAEDQEPRESQEPNSSEDEDAGQLLEADDQEPEETRENSGKVRPESQEEDKEDDSLEGEGHWDGKSFEWR